MRVTIVDIIDAPGTDAVGNVQLALDQFSTEHIQWHRIKLSDEPFTASMLEGTDKVLISGSKWSVYEEIPWKKQLEQLYQALANKRIATYAVCFGAQFLAAFLGGQVTKNPNGTEFGSVQVKLTEAGKQHGLLHGFDQQKHVHATHNDHIDVLPSQCELLAYNDNTAVQAFHYQNFFATQFHPDIPLAEINHLLEIRKEKYQATGVLRDNDHFIQVQNNLILGQAGYEILARFLLN